MHTYFVIDKRSSQIVETFLEVDRSSAIASMDDRGQYNKEDDWDEKYMLVELVDPAEEF